MLFSLLAANPFIDAYFESDLFGQAIFIGLFGASLVSWIIIFYKLWVIHQAKRASLRFYALFAQQRESPLGITLELGEKEVPNNPFLHLYALLKKQALDLLRKNQRLGAKEQGLAYLSGADIALLESHLFSGIATQRQQLEASLFILATVITLAPFLGLLGTVWGILNSFSTMHLQASSNQAILGGISLALTTTVLGLVDAIPALIGYNYLKDGIRSFNSEMDCFGHELLTSLEMQYRKVEQW